MKVECCSFHSFFGFLLFLFVLFLSLFIFFPFFLSTEESNVEEEEPWPILYPISSSASPNHTEQGRGGVGVAGLYQFKRQIWGMESPVGQRYN